VTPLSLKWRVSLLVTIVLIAVIAIISIVAHVEFQESHLRIIDQELLVKADDILRRLENPQNQEGLDEKIRIKTEIPLRSTPVFLYRIWKDGASKDLLVSDPADSERGLWLRELPEQNSLKRSERYVFINIGTSGKEYRAIWMRQKINEDNYNIVLASYSSFTYHEMHEFLRLLIILGGSLIIGSVAAVMWSVRCGLRPIDTTAAQLRKITHQNIGKTAIDDLKVPEELRPFAEALKDMLGRLDRVLQLQQQFTSDAAHELRTPLALAKSTLQTTQLRKRDSVEYEQAIDNALKDIACMEYLVEQLLTLARMEEAGQSIASTEVQLDVLLRELSETFGKKMQSTGGKVILEESAATTIRGNMDALIRLFSNVLDNAARYGPPDGTIRITLKSESDNFATVYIHDEGGNIPPEALPCLFDRFYRVDQSRSSSTGGVGLGLAIAHQIVHLHNGNISITSNPDSGTTVAIRLPCA
jgi:heavy metal sensor kinase